MKIHQIAIFLENRPGHIRGICKAIADAGVSITTLALADTQQYGILRLVMDDWEKGRDALAKAGYVVNVTEVLAVEVVDKPGGLLHVLDIISGKQINVEYMYAFSSRRHDNAIMIFRFDKPDEAITALQAADVKVLSGIDLFNGKA